MGRKSRHAGGVLEKKQRSPHYLIKPELANYPSHQLICQPQYDRWFLQHHRTAAANNHRDCAASRHLIQDKCHTD
jgi:hypothetical protein